MPAFPPDFPDDFESDPFDEPGAEAPGLRVGAGGREGSGARGRARANAQGPRHAGEGEGEYARTSKAAAAGSAADRPRRARARPSLKMQAIGYLSRREYSRQELRKKLLAWLRQRERDEAALAAAARAVAQEAAEALQDWPSNGIDDAFMPARPPSPQPGETAAVTAARSNGAALASLRRADGAPIPAALRQALAALAPEVAALGGDGAAPAPDATTESDATRLARLEREDPEGAVDQLLDWLAAQRYLSETRFVESRVNARARKNGTAMIKHELARHGLVLEPEQAATLRETEFARAQALWQRKFGEVATDPRLRARQARFLAARGFASDVVRRIVGGEEQD